MAGIDDLTNIMMAGGRGDVPPPGGMGGPPPGGPPPGMGGPPPGGPPPGMGGPPPGMGGPPPGMGGPPPGGPPPGMGEMAAAGGSPMGEEPPMDIEQDSAMLAEAVVGRAQGDIGQAIAVLDTAKAMLVASAEQPPMDGMGGPPMDPGMGGPPMQAAYGGPLYRQGGGRMSESDILRQMVMDSLQEAGQSNSPRVRPPTTSEKDKALQRLMRYRRS